MSPGSFSFTVFDDLATEPEFGPKPHMHEQSIPASTSIIEASADWRGIRYSLIKI